MKLFGIAFPLVVLALLFATVPPGVDAGKVNLPAKRLHPLAKKGTVVRDEDGGGGGGQGGAKLSCSTNADQTGSIIVSPKGEKKYTLAGVRDNQLIVGPPDQELTEPTTASMFTCTSEYMQTTADSQTGYFQVSGLCITVTKLEDKSLALTLEDCPTEDGPDLASQFFQLAQDAGGPYAKFVGAPGSGETIGFDIDDSDPQGLVIAVKGGGKVVLAVTGDYESP